ncbi:hypothetical protein IMSAGC011_02966 [Lachnospiraceae bacterium]|nr:hypothetical protein IMSAGC011_02966 [Lachnospiraceae bacterium]
MKKTIIKKGSTAQKAMLTAICFACALSVSACGKRDNRNENKDPITGADQSQTNESAGNEGGSETASGTANGDFSEFDAMIGDENTDPNSIMDYINTNIAGAAVTDISNFFSGLLNFRDDIRDIDFTRLEDSRQYMSEDMVAFMDLMRLEGDTPSMVMSDQENRKVINMILPEMLERARLFEQHLERFPNGVSSEAAARMYEEIATNAISGGYDKSAGVQHYYKENTNDTIRKDVLEYYQQFADAHPDSNLGKIVKEYINVLQTNGFKINDEVEAFYSGLHERLNVRNLTNNSTNSSQTGNNGTSNTANDGTENNRTENNDTGNNDRNDNIENGSTETSNIENSSVESSTNNTAKNNTGTVDTVINK